MARQARSESARLGARWGQTGPHALPHEWAGLGLDELFRRLQTSPHGLGGTEARRRLSLYGPNSLPRLTRRSWLLTFAQHFVHLFAMLLWVAALLAWYADLPQLAWAIIAVVVVNGLFSYWQQYQAERAVEALEALLPQQVAVRRGGQDTLVPAAEIVPGDLLVLVEGEAIPADARVVWAERLRIDASALTGESRPVARGVEPPPTDGGAAAELRNLVCAGTTVASGRGEAVVFGTGAATEFGRIAALTQLQPDRPSSLQRQMERVTRLITFLAIALGVIFFLTGTGLGGLSTVDGFLFAVGILVANVPEGLLPTITLALAMSVQRMARRNALIKRLEKVEALGATTIILTDKTGTLTQNEMTVRAVWADGAAFEVTGVGYAPDGTFRPLGDRVDPDMALLRTAALCCDAQLVPPRNELERWQRVGDPTEAAILVAAAKAGLSSARLQAWPRLTEFPFDSTRKRMTTIHRIDGAPVACVKGALDEVLARCSTIRWNGVAHPMTDRFREMVRATHVDMARGALRVLAVAARPLEPEGEAAGWDIDGVEHALTFLGLIGMDDPPRPQVREAITACRTAGIRVLMVTGDDGLTATAVAQQIGLLQREPRVLAGHELDRLDDAGLQLCLDEPDMLVARATPEHKLRLVRAFQTRGEVVAVTGDGVNDGPALKQADVGVAMGRAGTDVAREAADMVLADDHFASITAAIEEGRAVYDNLRKFVTYIFASNVPEIVPFIVFVLFRIPLPLTVMQILAVDLGTDLLPALALGAERPEPDVMRRPPRPRAARLLDAPTLLRAYGWLGAIEAALGLTAFFATYWMAGWRPGMVMPGTGEVYRTATTMSLAAIVMCQVGNAFACRSARQSVVTLGLRGNPLLLGGIAAELALLLLLIYTPPLAAVFGLAPLRAEHWALVGMFPALLLTLEEGRKGVLRRRAQATGAARP